MRLIISCIAVLFCTAVFGQANGSKDFKPATGTWKGTLTYLDYSSGKPFTMPANVSLAITAAGQVIFSYAYPKEPKANGKDTLTISKDGLEIDGAKIVSRKIMEDGSIQLITDKEGVDGNGQKKAVLRHIYTIGWNSFQNRKEVKFDGTDQWIMRNEYLFSRN